MSNYMFDKSATGRVTTYDLVAVICHHGTAASGHYTTYALNQYNETWYEFDDQYVTSVDCQQVANCDAYVLFYRKSNDEMNNRRIRALELMKLSRNEPSLLQFYVSKQWVNKFNTFAEPGPITNCDFLCEHGGVHPYKASFVHDLCTVFSHSVWEYLHMTFGGGPICTKLFMCQTCASASIIYHFK
jgi:ubiquitin carboxyl-terminal hydrolase 20/33